MKDPIKNAGRLRTSLSAMLSAAALTIAAGTASAAIINVQSVSLNPSGDLTVDNDFTRISEAIADLNDTDTLILEGVFDWAEPNAQAAYEGAGGYVFTGASWTDVTIQGAGGGATIRRDPSDVGDPARYFLYSTGALTNVTIENLIIENFDWTFLFYGAASSNGYNNLIVRDNVITGGPFRSVADLTISFYIYGAASDGITIQNNIFNVVADAAIVEDPVAASDYPQWRAFYGHPFNANNVLIDGNTFQVSALGTAPYRVTSIVQFLFDNFNRQGTMNMTFSNNVFDGGVDDGDGNIYRMAHTAAVISARSGELYDPPRAGVVRWTGNTFRNNLYAIDNSFGWSPILDPDVAYLEDTTFENNGWKGLLPAVDDDYLTLVGSNSPGLTVIRNLRTGTYGDPGGKKIAFTFPIDVNGNTDIEALYEMSNLGSFFEAIDDGAGGAVEAGIRAARVEPPDPTATVDPAVNALPWFSDPDGLGVDVVGYTVFPEPMNLGDPDDLGNTTNPDDVIELNPGQTYEYAVGTNIPHNLTIRTSTTKAGATGNPAIIVPVAMNFTGEPLFKVDAGVTLTLENVVVSGDSPNYGGALNSFGGVVFNGAGNLVATDVTFENFIGAAVDASDGDSVLLENCIIRKSGRGVQTGVGATTTVVGSWFEELGICFYINRGFNTFQRNVFLDNSQLVFSNSRSQEMDFGGLGQGNIFMLNPAISFNGLATPDAPYVMSHNWNRNIFADGANDNDGIVVGDVIVYRDAKGRSVEAGVLLHEPVPGTGSGEWEETSIIAKFDRDLDALPDAWEIGNPTDYALFDSDGDGWPDGVEVAMGTDPNDENDFPAGTFDINEDSNDSGYADWYEMALLANVGIEPFLGDVLRTSGVSLQDAVRSLQIVNGAFGPKTLNAGDLNALDVTGLGVSSLGNPLQILRYQAGVRSKFPALAGTN